MTRGSQRGSSQSGAYDVLDMCEKMLDKSYEYIQEFPRFYQLSLGADIRSTVGRLFRSLFYSKNKYRYGPQAVLVHLENAIVEMDFLRRLIRSAFSKKIISPRVYEEWSDMNGHIGRMTGGWHRKMFAAAKQQEEGQAAGQARNTRQENRTKQLPLGR